MRVYIYTYFLAFFTEVSGSNDTSAAMRILDVQILVSIKSERNEGEESETTE